MKQQKHKIYELMNIKNIMNRKTMNKKGALTDLFLFLIMSFILLVVCGIMIYIASTTNKELHKQIDGGIGLSQNYSTTVTATMGQVDVAYSSLYYLSIFIIVAMIISIFVGSYYVNTHPIFFVPYIFIIIIATIIAVVISNAYETVTLDPNLASTFAGFIGSNYIMYFLPMWTTVIGITGGIIMFIRMKSEDMSGYG